MTPPGTQVPALVKTRPLGLTRPSLADPGAVSYAADLLPGSAETGTTELTSLDLTRFAGCVSGAVGSMAYSQMRIAFECVADVGGEFFCAVRNGSADSGGRVCGEHCEETLRRVDMCCSDRSDLLIDVEHQACDMHAEFGCALAEFGDTHGPSNTGDRQVGAQRPGC